MAATLCKYMLDRLTKNPIASVRFQIEQLLAKQVQMLILTQRRNYPAGFPRLSPQQIKGILRQNDIRIDTGTKNTVSRFESNQLAANNPIEDRRAVACLLQTPGYLFGVFDGHGGHQCAQAVSERLFDYIGASLMPGHKLSHCRADADIEILERYSHENDYSAEARASTYDRALENYVSFLLAQSTSAQQAAINDKISQAFLRLDEDIASEVLPHNYKEGDKVDLAALETAFSGSCACVAHVEGLNLRVANAGDCRAILGIESEPNTYIAQPMSRQHDNSNEAEVKRIQSEHPPNEAMSVIKAERLLGQLMPFRAFGDVKYKLKLTVLKHVLQGTFYASYIPQNYYTPPYLTAEPEIITHRLTPRDKFLVLASDGLWDMLSPERVVSLVGSHMKGMQTVEPFQPSKAGRATLRTINEMLRERKVGLANRAIDDNCATHLIRNALGGTDQGIENSKLSNFLCIPEDLVRSFRDDMTIIIVYFNTDFIKEQLRFAKP